MRITSTQRTTNETNIKLTLNLDGSGVYEIDTGCGFLNHMLELFSAHGKFDITLACNGDVQVDYHHTTEDVGIALGQAFARALGEFGATLMVAGSIPGKTQTLSIAIYEAVQAGQDDLANMLVLITSITCITVLMLAGRLAPGHQTHRQG